MAQIFAPEYTNARYTSVFLSYPRPHLQQQQEFIAKISEFLQGRGLNPRTLGVTDYDMDAPLRAIRRLMLESNGLITIAFRRTLVEQGQVRAHTGLPDSQASPISGVWYTSPYCPIEQAMAYQLGLPSLLATALLHSSGSGRRSLNQFYAPVESAA